MTDPVPFALAVLALLATPGPTNTLLAASGASVGLRGSLRLIPAEICGYLISVSAILALAAPIAATGNTAALVMKLGAAGCLVCCSLRLWRSSGDAAAVPPSRITVRQVFTVTLVNPKGLVFGLAILPRHAPPEELPWLAAFAAMIGVVGCAWIAVGALAAGTLPQVTPHRVRRIAALVMAGFAVLITGNALASVH